MAEHRVIGFAVWSIVETDSGRTIGEGTEEFVWEDLLVNTFDTDIGRMQRLELRLTPPFRFGLARSLSGGEKSLSGFGLTADREDERTFSWEWFNLRSSAEAWKLQEAGRLGLKTVKHEGIEELVRTEFLTDVSLRVVRFAAAMDMEPKWRVNISKDSWVR